MKKQSQNFKLTQEEKKILAKQKGWERVSETEKGLKKTKEIVKKKETEIKKETENKKELNKRFLEGLK